MSVWFRMESTIACGQGAHPDSSADVSGLAEASATSGGRDLEQVGHSGEQIPGNLSKKIFIQF